MAGNVQVTYSVGPGNMIMLSRLRREGKEVCHEGTAEYIKAVCATLYPDLRLGITPAPEAGDNWVTVTVLKEFLLYTLAPFEGPAAEMALFTPLILVDPSQKDAVIETKRLPRLIQRIWGASETDAKAAAAQFVQECWPEQAAKVLTVAEHNAVTP